MAESGGIPNPPSPLAFASPQIQATQPKRSGRVRGYSHEYRTMNKAETPLEVHLERMRLAEALAARDHAVHCMESICSSLRRKESIITRLQHENTELETRLAAHIPPSGDSERPGRVEEIERLRALNQELQVKIEALRHKQDCATGKENDQKVVIAFLITFHRILKLAQQLPLIEEDIDCPADILSPISKQGVLSATEDAEKPETIIQARFAILAALPLPPNMPDDTLVPIVIPPPFTIHDFIGTAIGTLKAQ
ncbi:hypothetical protein NM688_g1785 [Phlebia brevispora]|uniref:Uncharacterized protein n=1 Tax=Phlebia brevispora TaxID=194682 RepID=A0ACC1TAC3_9APHY|nr:hypothetical protein NM688_g1785 [Phlebia brevispora]